MNVASWVVEAFIRTWLFCVCNDTAVRTIALTPYSNLNSTFFSFCFCENVAFGIDRRLQHPSLAISSTVTKYRAADSGSLPLRDTNCIREDLIFQRHSKVPRLLLME